MINPHKSPNNKLDSVDPPIADDIVRRLIDGVDTETLVFYDVSDCHLYGSKHKRKLSGTLTSDAESNGCVPMVYQSVLWFCVVFVPVWPLGTYFIIPCDDSDRFGDRDEDAEQFRGIRTKKDVGQILFHFWVLAIHVVAVIAVFVCCWRP